MTQQISHPKQLKNPKYRNWVKAGLGLKYLKDGLEDFSEDKVKELHTYILIAVNQKNNLSAVCCGKCGLKTLQPGHVRNKAKLCPLGNKDCNCQYPGGKILCPNNVCGALYDQIILNYASNTPTPCWKNTDVQKWCTDAWEVAKCYINAPGYASKSSASEIDSSGLLHLFINSKFLQSKIQCKITGQDVFSKTRSARNSIFHSHSMELEDSEVDGYLDDMIAVLKDGRELINRPASKSAVENLTKLRTLDFQISTLNEADVLSELRAEVDSKKNELNETAENVVREIQLSSAEAIQTVNTASEEFKVKTKQNIDVMEKSGNDIIKEFEEKRFKAASAFNADLEEKTDDHHNVLRKQTLEACDEIESAKKAAVLELETSTASTLQKIGVVEKQLIDTKKEIDKIVEPLQQTTLLYDQSKQDLKNSLVDMYNENVVNISPILLQPEHNSISVSDLYIEPMIEILPINQKKREDKPKQLQSYRELFRDDDQQQNLIYLIGEAGSGKTTFLINMINNWCIAHSGQIAEDSENVREMKHYEFLFYLSLRHEIKNDHIEEMVIFHYNDPIVKEILKKEPNKCLILLDGLDEWVQEMTTKSCCPFQSKGLPRRDLRKAYTIITTSRPWKFESIGVKDSEIHKKLKLRGVKNITAMAEKTIQTLNEIFDESKKVQDFEDDLYKCQIDEHMKSMPMVLQQLVCLWFDGKLKCVGKTAIYSEMLRMLFDWTNQRNVNKDIMKELRESQLRTEQFATPDQFNAIDECPEMKHVMKETGRLAYAGLFKTTRKESSLTFNEMTFQTLKIPNEVMSYCLASGIISKERSVGLNLSRRQHFSFSFVHKSLQEFLCALYIFSELKQKSNHLFQPLILHTIDKNIACFQEYFKSCKTADDILGQSNVFIFLCGFDTYLAAHISRFVYNIVVEDDTFIKYRTNLAYEQWDQSFLCPVMIIDLHGHPVKVYEIQNLLFSFIKEANTHVKIPKKIFFVSDIVFFGITEHELMKNINTAFVLSLNIFIEDHLPLPFSDFLNDPFLGPKLSTLKLNIWCPPSLIADERLSVIFGLLERSKYFLKSLILKGNKWYSRNNFTSYIVISRVLKLLPSLRVLETIKFEHFDITFNQIIWLSEWLTNSKDLRQISIRNVSDHPDRTTVYPKSPYIDLSGHHKLQFLDFNFNIIDMENFSVCALETCSFYIYSNSVLKTIVRELKRANNLKYAFFCGDDMEQHLSCNEKFFTRIFQVLLPRLSSLRQLHLQNIKFLENIIVEPFKMQNLRRVCLQNLIVAEHFWDTFLSNALLLPLNVRIELLQFGDFNYDLIYVLRRKVLQTNQFHNIEYFGNGIIFSTKASDTYVDSA